MGNHYATAVTVGAPQDAVIAQVRELQTYVSPRVGSYVVVFPNYMALGPERFSSVWRDASRSLRVPILMAAVFDDDVLYYELWINGELKDKYVSNPSVMDSKTKSTTPSGGNVKLLCTIFQCSDPAQVSNVLTAIRTDKRYIFETERHADLARALGLPSSSVGCSYDYIKQRDCPEGLSPAQLVETPK